MAHVEKVTPMVLKVDLQCPCCYKKVKKTLCKFPQIRDQVYDEKANTVTIKVVCCSPEKIRDKLCCKGGKAIKSIEIKEPPKPKPAEKPKEPEKPKAPEKPKEPEKPKAPEKPKEAEKPKVVVIEKPKEAAAEKPKSDGKGDKPKPSGAPPAEKPKEAAPKAEPAKNPEAAAKPAPLAEPVKGPAPAPVNGVPSVFPYVGPSYDAYAAGPYYHGYGFPPPQQCYEGYNGYGHGYGNGYGHGYGHAHAQQQGYGYTTRVVRNDAYSEDPQGCSIM